LVEGVDDWYKEKATILTTIERHKAW